MMTLIWSHRFTVIHANQARPHPSKLSFAVRFAAIEVESTWNSFLKFCKKKKNYFSLKLNDE